MAPPKPRFSIVVTCFNYEGFVGRAIESALAQTDRDTEVIVVDDGSTDGSASVIEGYAGRVRVVRQANGGHIAACNAGYAESSGDLILFLDADDFLDARAAERCVQAWQPSAAKVQFDLRLVDADGRDIHRRFCRFSSGYDAAHVRESFQRTGTYRWPVTAGNAYARSFLAQVMPLQIKLAPDGYLNTIAPLYGDVETLGECLGSYRLHGNNAWASNGRDFERLPGRISQRVDEIEEMRRHAVRRNVQLPGVNPLDHELDAVGNRLLAKKLGMSYPGGESDDLLHLWKRSVQLLRAENMPTPMIVRHLCWMTAMTWLPRPAVRALLALRQRRHERLRPFRALHGMSRASGQRQHT